MRYWLLKTEPETFSWDDQVRKGTGEWDGVRNPRARNNMKAMRRGDRAFFYHTGKERAVVGIVEVVAEAHPDSTDTTGRWECVDVAPVRPFARPVTLAEIKATEDLQDMTLVRNARLSVQSVGEEAWRRVCRMGDTDPD